MQIPAFILAGTHSGCGKTTVTLGILAALTQMGYNVQSFKVGPDFIDPGHHQGITGRHSHNLDGWMLSAEENRRILEKYSFKADVVVIEGVMGLFDGFSGWDDRGSTAHLARQLNLPLILIVDARSMARSAAAVVHGFTSFDPDLTISGVIFNRVGSKGHREILTHAMQSLNWRQFMGFLSREEHLYIPSRHLGLITREDLAENTLQQKSLAAWIQGNLNLRALLAETKTSIPPAASSSIAPLTFQGEAKINIGVAKDQAFCFYYLENLSRLEEAGARLIFFSPLLDARLPENIQGLYLGGGYPELHAGRLAANQSMLEQIRQFVQNNGAVYAECGGFMYLMQAITDLQGREYSLAGVFPMRCKMHERFKALGYREITTSEPSILGPAGTRIRGHEFHYSSITDFLSEPKCIYSVLDRNKKTRCSEGYVYKNVLGSYVHLHWGSNTDVPFNFLQYCRSQIHG